MASKSQIEGIKRRINKCCGYPELKKNQDNYCPFCYADIQWLKGYKEGMMDSKPSQKTGSGGKGNE